MREFEVNLPVRLSQHTASYQDLRRDQLPALHANSILQSWVGDRTGVRNPLTDRSGRHNPNSTPPSSSETLTSHTIDLGYPRSTSAYRLDYLQERKLDAYRRGMQLLAADIGMALPSIDIYV